MKVLEPTILTEANALQSKHTESEKERKRKKLHIIQNQQSQQRNTQN